jgi:hypothetical protein
MSIVLLVVGIFFVGFLWSMEDPALKQPQLQAAGPSAKKSIEAQIADLKAQGQKDGHKFIDNEAELAKVRKLLPALTSSARTSWANKIPPTLAADAKSSSDVLFGNFAPKVQDLRLRLFLSFLHMHQHCEELLKRALLWNIYAIKTAQRLSIAKGIVVGKDSSIEGDSKVHLFRDRTITAEGDVGYLVTEEGRVADMFLPKNMCASSPAVRSFHHYFETKEFVSIGSKKVMSEEDLQRRVMNRIADSIEIKEYCLVRLCNFFQMMRAEVVSKLVGIVGNIGYKKIERNNARGGRTVLSNEEARRALLHMYKERQISPVVDELIKGYQFSEPIINLLAPVKNLISLAEQVGKASLLFEKREGDEVCVLPLTNMVGIGAQLLAGFAELYSLQVREAYSLAYKKAYEQFRDLVVKKPKKVDKGSFLRSWFVNTSLPTSLSYHDQLFSKEVDEFVNEVASEVGDGSVSVDISDHLLNTFVIKMLLGVPEETMAKLSGFYWPPNVEKPLISSEKGVLQNLSQQEEARKKREQVKLSRNAKRREQRKKNKEKIDEFDVAALEKAVEQLKVQRAFTEKINEPAEIAGSSAVPSSPIATSFPYKSLPKVRYSRTLQNWLNGEYDATASAKDLRYHLEGYYADPYVQLHGRQSKELCPQGLNIAFEMPGEIHYLDGRMEQIMVRNIVSAEGVCFHREVKPLYDPTKLGEFAKSAYELHYPALGEETSSELGEIKTTEGLTVYESQFYICLKAEGQSTIYLYKPLTQ